MELFLANENMAFSTALVFLILVFILEVLSSGVISSMLDGLIPEVDINTDIDAEIDVGTDVDINSDINTETGEGTNVPTLSKLFIWVKDKVPMLVYFIIFLSIFCMIGFITQYFLKKITGYYLPWFFIVPGTFILSVLISRYISKFLSKFVFKDETTAVSSETFVGYLATITTSTAKRGKQVEARLTDGYGQLHYVYVEPEYKDAEFIVDEEVLLIRKRKDGSFNCVENELTERN